MEKQILNFNNDDDFIEFAINKNPNFYKSNDINYYDFDYSDKYNDSINNDIYFKIEDINSSINKRQELNYRLIVKPIKNLIL